MSFSGDKKCSDFASAGEDGDSSVEESCPTCQSYLTVNWGVISLAEKRTGRT